MKLLFACSDDNERQLYRIYLENTVQNADIVETLTSESAIEHLKNDSFNVAIISDKMTGGTPGDVFNTIKEYTPGTIFILFGLSSPKDFYALDGYKSVNENNTSIRQPLSPKDFQDQVLRAVSPSRSSLERVPAFQKVRLVHFYRFNKVLCNVYVQLSERKYVKVLNAFTAYRKEDLDKYNHQGIEYFYISNDDFEKFQASFTSYRYLDIDESALHPDEELNIMSCTHMVLHDLITKVGFSDNAVKLVEQNVKKVMKMISKYPDLSAMFTKQMKEKNYLYDHGYLVSIVCCNIFARLNWDTSENIFKLCTASVLHDLTIENPKLEMLEGVDDEKLLHFSKNEMDCYLNHPAHMANMLTKVGTISSEVIDIIKNHHETPQGDGFYNIHPSRLSKMACTFIIAHHYVQKMYEHEFNPLMHNIVLDKMRTVFTEYNFLTPMTGFEISRNERKQLVA